MRTLAVLTATILCATAAPAAEERPVTMKAMYEAMEANDVATVRRFAGLDRGSDFVFYGRYNYSLVHIAAEHDRPDILGALLATRHLHANLRKMTLGNRSTPLMVAADHGSTAAARVLLAAGAEVNAVNRYGGTALHFAAIRGAPEMVDLLLDAGADPMPRAMGRGVPKEERGFRALDFARKHNPELMASPAGKRLERLTEAGEGCDGATVEAGDVKLSILAERILGDAELWRKIAKLNGLGPEKSYRQGDCLKLPVR